MTSIPAKLWNCGWRETRQQHSKHKQSERWVKWRQNLRIFGNHENKGTVRRRSCTATTTTKRTTKRKDVNSVEFSETITKMRSITATLWLELRFNNNTGVRNRRKNRLEMFVRVRMGHDTDVMNWQYAGLRVISKSSGLPIVGDSKTIYVSKSRPFWNKYLFLGMVWFTVTYAKTTLVEHIPTTINEDPTILCYIVLHT